MTPTTGRPSPMCVASAVSWSGSASMMSPPHLRARRRRAARSASSTATTSSHAIPTAATSASTPTRSMDMGTTTTTEIAAGFDLALSEEQELAQRTARDFAREKVLPLAREIDEQGKIPARLIAEMASLGFLGIYVPESFGGAGLD